MESGHLKHPLVIHFLEEHQGERQDVLFRILSKHHTPLDRQIQESVNIEERMSQIKECLNMKNEWAGSKIPGITIVKPKGVMGARRQVVNGDRETDKDRDKHTHAGDQVDAGGVDGREGEEPGIEESGTHVEGEK